MAYIKSKMEKLKIVFANNAVDGNIVKLLEKLNREIKVVTANDKPDLLVFTGGEDVFPGFYGEGTGQYTHHNKNRDELESDTYYNLMGIPKLGICRGAQFLTVMNGGKLIQHVNNHGQEHTIQNEDDEVIKVTSTHHQMMYPYNLRDDQYNLLAWSQYFMSDTYLNGGNERIVTPSEFLEPEVVFYPNSKSLAIQGHPEYGHATEEFVNYALELIRVHLFDEKPKARAIKFTDPFTVRVPEGVTFGTFGSGIGKSTSTIKIKPEEEFLQAVRAKARRGGGYNTGIDGKVSYDKHTQDTVKARMDAEKDAWVEQALQAAEMLAKATGAPVYTGIPEQEIGHTTSEPGIAWHTSTLGASSDKHGYYTQYDNGTISTVNSVDPNYMRNYNTDKNKSW